MAVYTTKIQWRSPYSLTDLRTKVKNHYANAGWTLVDDQSASAGYIVVTKDRGTSFPGDNPIAIVYVQTYWPGIYMKTCDSWNATTHTGTNVTPDYEGTLQIQNSDCDIWISTDDTFTVMGVLNGSSIVGSCPIIGLCAMERETGDNDGGSMYGQWRSDVGTQLRVASVKTGNVTLATNLLFSCQTPLGGVSGLSGVDDAGNDLMWSLTPFAASYGKIKNQLHGIRICTSNKFTNGSDTGGSVIDGYKWMFLNLNASTCFAMPVASSVSVV
jgi:hypothetical protein